MGIWGLLTSRITVTLTFDHHSLISSSLSECLNFDQGVPEILGLQEQNSIILLYTLMLGTMRSHHHHHLCDCHVLIRLGKWIRHILAQDSSKLWTRKLSKNKQFSEWSPVKNTPCVVTKKWGKRKVGRKFGLFSRSYIIMKLRDRGWAIYFKSNLTQLVPPSC